VLLKTPVLKYFYMLMTQKYIKLFVIIMINRTAVCTESDEKWSDEWLLKLNIDKRKSVSYCIKHPVKPVSDMTYNVFSGTLNPTQSINYNTVCHITGMDRHQLISLEKVTSMVDLQACFVSTVISFLYHISEKNN